MFSPNEARILAGQSEELMKKPFFDSHFGKPDGELIPQLLAQAFPARTNPAGRNPVGIFNANGTQRNFNMVRLKNGWFTTGDNASRWLHSDIRDVAYLYTYKAYVKFTELGQLDK